MTTTAENVVVGQSGAIYGADLGSTLPTSASGAPGGDFTELGFITEGGVTESQPESTTKIKAWQGGTVVRVVRTEHELTYKFAMLETNEDTLAAFYGNYDGGTVEVNAAPAPHKSYVIDVLDGDQLIRICIPDGQVTARSDVQYVNGAAAMYEVTVTCYEDPDYAGAEDYPAKAYKYHATAGASA